MRSGSCYLSVAGDGLTVSDFWDISHESPKLSDVHDRADAATASAAAEGGAGGTGTPQVLGDRAHEPGYLADGVAVHQAQPTHSTPRQSDRRGSPPFTFVRIGAPRSRK